RVEPPVRAWRQDEVSPSALAVAASGGPIGALGLFFGSRLDEVDRRTLDALVAAVRPRGGRFVGIVSSCQAHLGDRRTVTGEALALGSVAPLAARTAVFRRGHVINHHSPAGTWLRRLGFGYPLVPQRLRSCFLEGTELFAVINAERQRSNGPRWRVVTVLGPNRPWREVLRERRGGGRWSVPLTAASALLAFLLLGHLAAGVLNLLTRWWPS